MTRILQEKRRTPGILYRVITNTDRSLLRPVGAQHLFLFTLGQRERETSSTFANRFLLGERRWISGSQLNFDRDFRSIPVERFHERIRARYSFTIRWGIVALWICWTRFSWNNCLEIGVDNFLEARTGRKWIFGQLEVVVVVHGGIQLVREIVISKTKDRSLIVVIIEEAVMEDQFFFKIKFTEVDSWFRVKILEWADF